MARLSNSVCRKAPVSDSPRSAGRGRCRDRVRLLLLLLLLMQGSSFFCSDNEPTHLKAAFQLAELGLLGDEAAAEGVGLLLLLRHLRQQLLVRHLVVCLLVHHCLCRGADHPDAAARIGTAGCIHVAAFVRRVVGTQSVNMHRFGQHRGAKDAVPAKSRVGPSSAAAPSSRRTWRACRTAATATSRPSAPWPQRPPPPATCARCRPATPVTQYGGPSVEMMRCERTVTFEKGCGFGSSGKLCSCWFSSSRSAAAQTGQDPVQPAVSVLQSHELGQQMNRRRWR